MASGATCASPATGRPGDAAVNVLGYAAGRLTGMAPGHDVERIHETCAQRGWRLVGIVRDGPARGGRGRRPGLEYALEQLGDGVASGLVVARLEALCPSLADLGDVLDEIQERGGRLVCIEPDIDTHRAEGRTIVLALSAVSRQERERLAARTRKGLETARGRRAATRPALEDRPDLRDRIVAMRRRGMTLQAIADVLNAEGVPTVRGGKRWRPSSLHAATAVERDDRDGSR
jgi:DNA invertase Pin-like site-specific DNA recombinase